MFIKGVKYIEQCSICEEIRKDDLVLEKNDRYVVYVCRRPYNNGHLIVAPRRHVSLRDAEPQVISDLFKICKRCIRLLSEAYSPHGFNIDIVQRPHVAMQVVPRWNGDASFVSVFHNTRVIAEPPQLTLRYLKEISSRLSIRLLGDV
ncbi:MAG: HIT domain-containing protein [Crenarchaeota archaeon]|nr:HIT domain-containing protein [Thermoproteota archaeon]